MPMKRKGKMPRAVIGGEKLLSGERTEAPRIGNEVRRSCEQSEQGVIGEQAKPPIRPRQVE